MSVNFTNLKINKLKEEIIKLSIELKAVEDSSMTYSSVSNRINPSLSKHSRVYRKIMKDKARDLIHKINGALDEIDQLEKEKLEEKKNV